MANSLVARCQLSTGFGFRPLTFYKGDRPQGTLLVGVLLEIVCVSQAALTILRLNLQIASLKFGHRGIEQWKT